MKLVIGSDHAAFELKQELVDFIKKNLKDKVEAVLDVGTHSTEPCDYPDFAEKVAEKVLDHSKNGAERGIMICGSGVGACVASNKIPGIRAGICHDIYSVHQGVEHDHMNVLILGARIIGIEVAKDLVCSYVKAEQSQNERHLRRLRKVKAIEDKYSK